MSLGPIKGATKFRPPCRFKLVMDYHGTSLLGARPPTAPQQEAILRTG